MSLFVTPGQLSRRADLYQQMAQLLGAGIGLIQALEHLDRNPPSRALREPIRLTLENIRRGSTFADALRAARGELALFDIALLEAGERSGRLDNCLRQLADYYRARAQLAQKLIAGLRYPVLLIHFAALIFGIVLPFAWSQFHTSLAWLFFRTFLMLLPIYLLTFVIIYAMQSQRSERWRARLEFFMNLIPVLGTARRSLAVSRLALALGALINAGVNIIEAWELAADTTGSPALRRTVAAWGPLLAAGQTPGELLGRSRKFPDLFTNYYQSGEVSGKLDESLARLHTYYQEEGTRKMEALAQWVPRAIYFAIALFIAYMIIMAWSRYFNTISDITKGF